MLFVYTIQLCTSLQCHFIWSHICTLLHIHQSGYSAVWLLQGWCHIKLLPSQHAFCVHHTTVHQFTVSLYLKPHMHSFAYPPKWLQCCLVVTGLVPHETAAISACFLCTPYSCAPVYSVALFEATYVGWCVFGCILPSAFLAEWLGSFFCC